MKRRDLTLRVLDLKKQIKTTKTEEGKNKIQEEIDRIINYLRETEYEYTIEELIDSLNHENDKLNRPDAVNRIDFDYNGQLEDRG